MVDQPPSSSPKTALSGGRGLVPAVEPLTRGNYKRSQTTQSQIGSAVALDAAALRQRARERDESQPDYLSPEALVYFIRCADRDGDGKTREALFRELLERCTPFFRGKFRGFSKEMREDLQGDVQKRLVEDILASDDRGDFMQVRFWTYLERRTIEACRAAFKPRVKTESLDTGKSGHGEPEGRSKLETLADHRLTPEEFTTLSQALATLTPHLRHVFLLRHYVGMKIGGDNADDDDPNELTMAQHFGCTGRTIRNWLKEAGKLLEGFRETKE